MAEIQKISEDNISVGCYRRKIVFIGSNSFYINGKKVFESGGAQVSAFPNLVYDIVNLNDNIIHIDSHGNVFGGGMENRNFSHSGLFSGLEITPSFLVAAHDISHNLRFIDKQTFETTTKYTMPSMVTGLSNFHDDCVTLIDGNTIAVMDPRLSNLENSAIRSTPLPSVPIAVSSQNFQYIVVSGDDRRLRVFDARKMKTPVITTKPSTKNGTIAMHLDTKSQNVACIGCDESLTIVDLTLAEAKKDTGQFKRGKFLSEAPWVSMATQNQESISILARNGKMYTFQNVFETLKQLQNKNEDDELDGE